MKNDFDAKQLWKTFSAAIGAELREDCVIRGVSGLEHPVQAIAVDDKTQRVIVVSAELNPRVAALMQWDIQATLPDCKVLVARPITIELKKFAQELVNHIGTNKFKLMTTLKLFASSSSQDLSKNPVFHTLIKPIERSLTDLKLPLVQQLQSVVQQAASLDWPSILEEFKQQPDDPSIILTGLLESDMMSQDVKHGICPIPLNEFHENDWDLFSKNSDIDEVQSRLKQLGIFQYFYPPVDQLALGLVDRGIHGQAALLRSIESSPLMGHPYGESEIIQQANNVLDVIDGLEEREYLVSGELNFDITQNGSSLRSNVKFQPREGLVSKLINRVNIEAKPADVVPLAKAASKIMGVG